MKNTRIAYHRVTETKPRKWYATITNLKTGVVVTSEVCRTQAQCLRELRSKMVPVSG